MKDDTLVGNVVTTCCFFNAAELIAVKPVLLDYDLIINKEDQPIPNPNLS